MEYYTYLFVGCFLLTGAVTRLTSAQSDQVVLAGSPIRLSCALASSTITWKNSADTAIFDGFNVDKRFQKDGASSDLTATNVDETFCDTYTCVDNDGNKEFVDVVVFRSVPQCNGIRSISGVVDIACNVSSCSNNKAPLRLEQSGQTLVNGSSSRVDWNSSLTSDDTITCVAADGIDSVCEITTATTTRSSLSTTTSIGIYSSVSSTTIVCLACALAMLSSAFMNGSFKQF